MDDRGLNWRLQRRSEVSLAVLVASTLLGLVLTLVLTALLLASVGVDPGAALLAIARAGFIGGRYALSDTAVKATPLMLCGLACVVAFRANLWNVGAEGQLFVASVAKRAVVCFLTRAPTLFLVFFRDVGHRTHDIAGDSGAVVTPVAKRLKQKQSVMVR